MDAPYNKKLDAAINQQFRNSNAVGRIGGRSKLERWQELEVRGRGGVDVSNGQGGRSSWGLRGSAYAARNNTDKQLRNGIPDELDFEPEVVSTSGKTGRSSRRTSDGRIAGRGRAGAELPGYVHNVGHSHVDLASDANRERVAVIGGVAENISAQTEVQSSTSGKGRGRQGGVKPLCGDEEGGVSGYRDRLRWQILVPLK